MIKVLEVAGARPNYMKIAPIHRAMLAAGGFTPVFVHTGQHYDWEMSSVFLQDLGLPAPHAELGVGSGTQAEQTAQVMVRLEPVLMEHRPDVVLVVGDVNSTLGAALAAVKLLLPVAHVEAGLRSFDRTMPEEINRVLTDTVSELLFAPSSDAVANLEAEGIAPDKIHLVGNVMIDSLDSLLPRAQGSDVLDRLGVEPSGYLVATLHRPSNVDGETSLRLAMDILSTAAASLPVLLVAHPRTRKRLIHAGLSERFVSDGVRLVEPLGYLDFLCLMSRAAGVLTDSGGIQEETTVLGVPCLTLRDRTERPVTVTEGTNQVVGLDSTRIEEAVRRLSEDRELVPGRPRRPELWDGCAATRIVEVLRNRFG
jgi:UDP-N-acetylglucosamine 2-epimerase (non-hydrolysing)